MKNLLKINSNAFLLTQSFFFCLIVFMVSSYGLLFFSIICCLSLWIISIFINSRQGTTKSKLLDYCTLPFFYYLIQSPVFPIRISIARGTLLWSKTFIISGDSNTT